MISHHACACSAACRHSSRVLLETRARRQVVDAEELTPAQELGKSPALLAVAAFFGTVRLIDNAVLPLQGADGEANALC